MAKANCVYITPPTNTPVDTTSRRAFLIVAAFASVAGAGSLAFAAAAPNDVPKAVTIPPAAAIAGLDPVFGLIDAHRKAGRDHEAALVEQERLERIGDRAADWVGEAPCHAEFKALDVLLAAPATTLPGLVAKLAYLQDIAHRGDAWMLTDRPDAAILLLEGFVASVANVMAVPS